MSIDSERSGPHRLAERWATELGIAFTSECRDFPPYLVDMYFPEWHLGLEIDGPYHGARRDAVRDAELLLKYGLTVRRIPATARKEEFVAAMIASIEDAAIDAEMRKVRMRERPLVG